MGEIRAFAEEHVPDAAALFLKTMRGRKGPAGQALQDYFREILLRNPWVSADLPSLVYFDRGKLVGFLGVVPRPMEFRGRTIRLAAFSQFMVDREQYRGPAALELLRRLFESPHDLCMTDGAGESTHVLWKAAGGQAAQLYSFNWLRMLRPIASARSFLDRTTGAVRWLGGATLAAAAPLDFLLAKLPHDAFRPPQTSYISRPVAAGELFDCIQRVGWREPLKPSYDLSSFKWLMSQAASARLFGELRMAAVSTPDGDLCGWYVYYANRGGPSSLLQIGSRRRDLFDGVLTALFRDAWQQGSSSVKGQAIPAFLVNLTAHYCLFRQANTSVLVQSRDPALVDAILRGQAALSRLDSDSWMRFAGEPWT
jgi:hypothetical protein